MIAGWIKADVCHAAFDASTQQLNARSIANKLADLKAGFDASTQQQHNKACVSNRDLEDLKAAFALFSDEAAISLLVVQPDGLIALEHLLQFVSSTQGKFCDAFLAAAIDVTISTIIAYRWMQG